MLKRALFIQIYIFITIFFIEYSHFFLLNLIFYRMLEEKLVKKHSYNFNISHLRLYKEIVIRVFLGELFIPDKFPSVSKTKFS